MEFRPHSLKLLILSEIRNKLRELLFDVIQREDDYIEVSQLTENSILVADLLLQNHQASPQTNFGRIRDQPGFPAPDARLICLSRLYITAFASISSNRNRGSSDSEKLLPSKWYRCGRENPVSLRKPRFRGRRV